MKWFYLENHPHFVETIPFGFRALGIPLTLPPAEVTPQELKSLLTDHQPDVILTTGWTPLQREPYFRVVQDYCARTRSFHVFWSFEDPLHTETWGMYYAEMGQPDFVFTHALGSAHSYQRVAIPSAYLPMACNPKLHRSLPARPRFQSDITLVANFATATHRSWRLKSLEFLLKPLLENGYDVAIWGSGWLEKKHELPFEIPDRSIKGPLSYHEIPYVYASSKIVLGIQNSPYLLTRRTFECLATGGFLLTNLTPAVQHHFQPGVHLETVSGPGDTLDKVDFFLREPGKRKEIGRKGQQEVHRRHTYAHRVQEMQHWIEPHWLEKKKKGRFTIQIPRELKQEIRPRIDVTFRGAHQGHLGQYLFVGRVSPRSPDCQVFLQFVLPEQKPYLSSLIEAKLKLFVVEPPHGEPIVRCQTIETPWTMESLRQGKLPSVSRSPIGEVPIRRSLASYYPWSENWYVFDLTAVARKWWSGALPNYGIRLSLRGTSPALVRFTSSRWQGRSRHFSGRVYFRRFFPRLEVVWQTNPGELSSGRWPAFP